MKPSSLLLALPVVLALGCAHTLPAPPPTAALAPDNLRSPWDNTPVRANAQLSYDCGAPVPIGPDITVTTSLDSGRKNLSEDVKAAVYSESSRALQDLSKRVVSAADMYRNTGNLAAAACVSELLTDAAAHMALTGTMVSTDAWNQHNYGLRATTIAYLKVRPSGVIDPQHAMVIATWLDGLARMERAYVEGLGCVDRKCPVHSRTGNQVATAAAAAAVADNDPGLFHWAVGEYKSAVGSINDQGMLRYDSKGRWAVKWNLQSAAALVQIAELAETNNEPLYGYDNGRIHLLVHTVALGLIDPAPFKNATHAEQRLYNPIPAWQVVWASVYVRRFPDPVLKGLLHQVGPVSVDMWGGEPWAAEDES